MKIIGLDNGVTGSIAILDEMGDVVRYCDTPVIRCLNYTKTKAFVNRVDVPRLIETLKDLGEVKCWLERPMVNPGRFKATVSALRCLEATQIVLEQLKIPYEFIDSKEWQKEMLPKGLKKEELKLASDQICSRLFPSVVLSGSGRGDSLLIAEYARRNKI